MSHRLLYSVLSLHLQGRLKQVSPVKLFPISQTLQAFRFLQDTTRIGKVAISVSTEESLVPLKNPEYRTRLSSEKTYLMVGCLGGIGRSICRWLVARGAKKLVFIGRSGASKPSPATLIRDLEESGIHTVVISGDISQKADAEALVKAASTGIGGVIHAAMGVSESIFSTMSLDKWHQAIDPKARGALNLHEVLQSCPEKARQLDFFVLISSLTGSIGWATESNYSAANAFLDSFATFRRGLGLPCTSLSLGVVMEVGYFAENEDAARVVRRQNFQPISERDVLRLVDIVLTEKPLEPTSAEFQNGFFELGERAHYLTGLEPPKASGQEGSMRRRPEIFSDPRAAVLDNALVANAAEEDKNEGAGGSLPSGVTAILTQGTFSDTEKSTLIEDISATLCPKVASLLSIKESEMNFDEPIAELGMDSMLAAELRQHIFWTFRVDAPLLTLLSALSTVKTVAETITMALIKLHEQQN